MMNLFKKKPVLNFQVETEIFNHVKQVNLAYAICKYLEHIDEKFGKGACFIGSKVFRTEPDLIARTTGMSSMESYLQSPEFQLFLLSMVSFSITFGALFLVTLYYMLKP